jgi:hypothetical protein
MSPAKPPRLDADAALLTMKLCGEPSGASGCVAELRVVQATSTPDGGTFTRTWVIPVLLDAAAGRFALSPSALADAGLPAALRRRIERAWRNGKGVDLLDECERPLLREGLRPHPEGLAHWLRGYAPARR